MKIELTSDILIDYLAEKYNFGLNEDGKVDIDLKKLETDDFISLFNAYTKDEGEDEFFLTKVDEDTIESHVDGNVTRIPLSILRGNIKDEMDII
jgi:inorganic pyrophosphatase/exopolyphosphatase